MKTYREDKLERNVKTSQKRNAPKWHQKTILARDFWMKIYLDR